MKIDHKKYKGVLFDLDGTILFTLSDITAAFNVPLLKRGVAGLNDEETREIVGHGLYKGLADAFDKRRFLISETDLKQAYKELMDYYKNNSTKYCYVYENIENMLNKIDVPFGILSNKDDKLVREIVATVLPSIEFAFVRGMTTIESKKPNPVNVIEFATKYSIDMKDLLYVGDSEVDYKTSVNAKCDLALVSWGYRDKESLLKFGSPICDTADQLLGVINGN
jgi:phosphoglycolate phosphatase